MLAWGCGVGRVWYVGSSEGGVSGWKRFTSPPLPLRAVRTWLVFTVRTLISASRIDACEVSVTRPTRVAVGSCAIPMPASMKVRSAANSKATILVLVLIFPPPAPCNAGFLTGLYFSGVFCGECAVNHDLRLPFLRALNSVPYLSFQSVINSLWVAPSAQPGCHPSHTALLHAYHFLERGSQSHENSWPQVRPKASR